jgi:Fe-S-cluster-containing dehydrogenase component
MKKLSVVPNLCIGCRECELMCSLKHHGVFNPAMARIHVNHFAEEKCYEPAACMHCDEPACAEACPVEAMSPDERTGAMVIDADACTMCYQCAEACPHDAINIAPGGEVLKCDLCGGEPVCVEFCSKRPEKTGPMVDNPEAAAALVFTE